MLYLGSLINSVILRCDNTYTGWMVSHRYKLASAGWWHSLRPNGALRKITLCFASTPPHSRSGVRYSTQAPGKETLPSLRAHPVGGRNDN